MRYSPPPLVDMAVALGPAAALAAFGLFRGAGDPASRAHVVAWAGMGLSLAVFRPFAISLQFLVCIGVPLFVLGARALSRAAPRTTALFALVLSSTSVVAIGIVLQPNPRWFVPRERFDAALELRRTCRPGQRVLAPADIRPLRGGPQLLQPPRPRTPA